ncbi:MAG TPA: hypothetical protein VGS08_06005 [Candidatus Saccharimonadales bacterium]|nr:hypothetical protein [Candidatus Saccharimonadales bacterium]
MTISKKIVNQRTIHIALGLLWMLDGAFQLQPKMFTRAFVDQVIAPVAQGQPGWVSSPINAAIHIFLLNSVLYNLLIAFIQLTIGGLILCKRTTRYGLYMSVCWGLIVWSLGEGYGGIFSGHASLLTGAPGAALLYVFIALAVIPSKKKRERQTVASWLVFAWLVLWVGGGAYQLLPQQGTTADIGSTIATNAEGAPSWMASADLHTASRLESLGPHAEAIFPHKTTEPMIMSHMDTQVMSMPTMVSKIRDTGRGFIVAFGLALIVIGIGVLFEGIIRLVVLLLGVLLSLSFWVIGQSMGGFYTGMATDLNSGPLFVLLGVAILMCSNFRFVPRWRNPHKKSA